METDFRAILAGDATISGLVTTAGVTRIYPSAYAQGAASPALRYMRVSGAPGLHMRGSDGLDSALMQVDCRAASAASALAVRDALVAKLHGFSGAQGGSYFQLIALQSDRGVRFDDTGPTAYYTASLDFECWSRQTT
jgi:hypothetical protein